MQYCWQHSPYQADGHVPRYDRTTKTCRHSHRYTEPLATVGNGVELRQSGIPAAGNGLWTTRYFLKGDAITKYEGTKLSRPQVAAALAANPQAATHFIRYDNDYVIDGLKNAAEAIGQGGASFANNHDDARKRNAKLETSNSIIPVIYLKAKRTLRPNTEIFVRYGPINVQRMAGVPVGRVEDEDTDSEGAGPAR